MLPSRLPDALARARQHLLDCRLDTGGFPDRTDVGPSYTAFPLIALHYANLPLPAEQTRRIVAWLKRQQRSDGSWVPYPFAAQGDLCATAAVWAALRCTGLPESDAAVERAHRYIEAHGGLKEVAAALFSKTNFAALFVAMAGYLDPSSLPLPSPGFLLNPLAEQYLRRRFDYLNVVVGLVCAGAILDQLRRRKQVAAADAAGRRGTWLGDLEAKLREAAIGIGGAIESVDDRSTLDFLRSYQNPNGSLDDTTLQTALLVAAYRALELPVDDPRPIAAAAWLRGMIVEQGDEAWWSCFTGDVWTTALAARALLRSGVSSSDPALQQTIAWLLDSQLLEEGEIRSTTRPGAPRIGGWAFEHGNITVPDCDDTGLVLATLGMAADDSEPGPGLAEPLRSRLLAAAERGCLWLKGNQNPDGGWSGFDYWEGGKPRGPMYTTEIGLFSDDWLQTLKNVVNPPVGLGGPAWEDVTGRVLVGLGYSGYTFETEEVARAIAFLRQQQLDHGGWWGRWMVNYLPTTACVLLGLSAVELPTTDPMMERGVAFLLAHQNPDGGWGEDEETYRDPSRAGTGPSMPPLTGLVLSALLDVGQGGSEAVARGIDYLLREQRSDGSWPNGEWLHAFFPPQSFYHYHLQPALYPLEALGRYHEFLTTGEVDSGSIDAESAARAAALGTPDPGPPRTNPDEWDDPFLDAMRKLGDPTADRVIKALFEAHDVAAVNGLLRTLVQSDDPIPAGLPDEVRAYFAETSALPSFADPVKLALAADLFARAGWSVAAGLFCAALPQSYAAAKGAKVLVYSGRLDADVRRRILETAQFIFDVTDRGGLGPEGRGVRTAQKVRLMHATLRHLIVSQARWDMSDGLPINQEDLGATLMTFSTVILDSLDRFGIAMSTAEREAWMHLWNCVGFLLGVDPDLLPEDEADGKRLMDAIRRRHWRSSPQGQLLGRALVDCMREYLPAPGLERLPSTLVRHLAGDRCAELLALPQSDWTSLLIDAAGNLLDFAERRHRDQHIARLVDSFSSSLMKGLIAVQRDGKQAPFRLPASLRST